jgi:hypothetical protein
VPIVVLLEPLAAVEPPAPRVEDVPDCVPLPAAEPPVPRVVDELPLPAVEPPTPRVDDVPEPVLPPADDPPVPSVVLEEPEPAVEPPAPIVELVWAKAITALPTRKVVARAALRMCLNVMVRVSFQFQSRQGSDGQEKNETRVGALQGRAHGMNRSARAERSGTKRNVSVASLDQRKR